MEGQGSINMSPRTQFLPSLVISICSTLTVLSSTPTAAQPATVDFTVSGTSTIRGWTCTVQATVQVTPGSSDPAPGFTAGVETATLTAPVNAFECPNDEMTEHLLEAMKADRFPEITFQLEDYEVSGQQVETTGALTITGVTESVRFPVSLAPSGEGIEIEGELRLDMTTFGVEPPVVMLGLLQVRPQIRIEFEGLIAQ